MLSDRHVDAQRRVVTSPSPWNLGFFFYFLNIRDLRTPGVLEFHFNRKWGGGGGLFVIPKNTLPSCMVKGTRVILLGQNQRDVKVGLPSSIAFVDMVVVKD